jgi:hypothetical protein
MISIDRLKKDIIDYDLYWVVDSIPYGDYFLSILNESDKVIIAVYDEWGSAAWEISKDEFLNITTDEELEKHINSIIYYNYIAYEGE